MSKPAFTPGPWSVSSIRTRESGVPVLTICGADEKAYAMVLYSDRTPELHRASYADTRLIAAAPEMFEALTEMLDHFGDSLEPEDARNYSIDRARAILAKVQS